MCSKEPVHFQLPIFDRFTPDDLNELLSYFEEAAAGDDHEEPLNSNSGSGSGSGSGSDETNRAATSEAEVDHDRQLRRKLSNRDSARRSRWRKKRQLENLTNQVHALKVQNREFKIRVGLVRHQNSIVKSENERLYSECILLRHRLSDLHRVLIAMREPLTR